MNANSEASVQTANDRALKTLVRTITLSQGEFSLILVRCNYLRLRAQIQQQLKAACPVQVSELELSHSSQTLYTTIRNYLETQDFNRQDASASSPALPQALAVVGLESVENLNVVLGSANLVRDEFLTLPFPIVLWVDDAVLDRLRHHAKDLKNWTSVALHFTFPPEELLRSLRSHADQLFDTILEAGSDRFLPNKLLNLEQGSRLRTELDFALKDIAQSQHSLDPELQASLNFVRGRDAHSRLEMEDAQRYYQASLTYWHEAAQQQQAQESALETHTSEIAALREKEGCLLLYLGLWWRSYAVLQRAAYATACQQAREYFEQCLDLFRQQQRLDLVAKFILALAETLQKLAQGLEPEASEAWQRLEAVTQEALSLHQATNDRVRLARDYGFLAEVALAKANWQEAKQWAETALKTLDQTEAQEPEAELDDSIALAERYQRGWYLLLLGRSQAELGHGEDAIALLQSAQICSDAQADPVLYIRILAQLRTLLFARGHYLKAFHVKRKQQVIEQQFGFRAFAGAGRIEPQADLHPAQPLPSSPEAIVAQEIAASGRQQDVERLLARIGTPRDKLTVIHGPSGVGKSSILNAGLVPALRRTTFEARQILPIVLPNYNSWTEALGRAIAQGMNAIGLKANRLPSLLPVPVDADLETGSDAGLDANLISPASPPDLQAKVQDLLAQLKQNQGFNLITTLIFDQFEEFFFVCPDPLQRKPFYLFLRDCLNIPYVKVVLSLREDYLHYLLEIDRLANLEVINNDILGKDIRYYLGDFTPEDAESVIRNLTNRSQFYLEDELIVALVRDLAGELGGVRPIELQIVGAQLQDHRITTLQAYQQLGDNPKEQLVQRSLANVVQDCGSPNALIAQVVLFLLTAEDGTRPLKTRLELAEELRMAEIPFTTPQLDLVLEILVGSGLVLKVLETSTDLYQLVHDYLVSFIRQNSPDVYLVED